MSEILALFLAVDRLNQTCNLRLVNPAPEHWDAVEGWPHCKSYHFNMRSLKKRNLSSWAHYKVVLPDHDSKINLRTV